MNAYWELYPTSRAIVSTVSLVGFPGGIDTDMLAGIEAPKTPSAEVADGILSSLAANLEDIFPDPNSRAMSEVWWPGPKSFERAFSGVARAA